MFNALGLIKAADEAAKAGYFDFANSLLSAAGKSPDWPYLDEAEGSVDLFSRRWRAERHNWYSAMALAKKIRSNPNPWMYVTPYGHNNPLNLTQFETASSSSWIKAEWGSCTMTITVPLNEVSWWEDEMGTHRAVMFEDSNGNVWFFRKSQTGATSFFGQVASVKELPDNENKGYFALVIYEAGDFESGLVPAEAKEALTEARHAANQTGRVFLEFYSARQKKFLPLSDLGVLPQSVVPQEELSKKLAEYILKEEERLANWAAKLDEHWANTQKLVAEAKNPRRVEVDDDKEDDSFVGCFVDLSKYDEGDEA